jgi:aspartyl-tRNA(Asn)/glutamyl-tRNA(Gln) amidotransferase subunit A
VAAGEDPGVLAGVPVGVKDIICTAGMRTTAGSKILERYVPAYDATVTARLRRAGAVVVGKLNCDEFAMGSSNENSAYKPARNPWAGDRVPGGSSGGSGASVAALECHAALGTNTGGSIRLPAAYCGVVGLKPTYGRVSRYGLVAFASSLDQIGPLTRSVSDAARLYRVVAGVDPLDSTTAAREIGAPEAALGRGVAGMRVGFLEEAEAEGLDPEVAEDLERARAIFRDAGAEVVSVSVPRAAAAIAIYYVIASAEASSNLARFDGVRYGPRVSEKDLASLYVENRTAGFGPEVKRRILLGTFALASGYYEAYYGLATRARQLLCDDFDRAFSAADVIVCPSIPSPAFRIGEKTDDPLTMYLSDVFTVPASLAGLPAISVPSGLTRGGLPLGIQVLAPRFGEEAMFAAARAFEEGAGFPDALPSAAA